MTSIEIAEQEELEAGAYVELDVGNSHRVYITVSAQTTSVVLADETEEKQASIMVKEGEWTLRER